MMLSELYVNRPVCQLVREMAAHARDSADYESIEPYLSHEGECAEVMNMDEVAAFLRVARNTAYAAANAGVIPSYKVGGRVLVLRSALLEAMRGGVEASESQDVDFGGPFVGYER